MPEESHIYLAFGLCATQQSKSSISHFYYSSESYGQAYTQFGSTHEILVHPICSESTAFLSLILQPIEYK